MLSGLDNTKATSSSLDPRNHHYEVKMHNSRGTVPSNLRGVRNKNRHRISTSNLSDWLKEHLRNMSAKEIADYSGCGVRAAENAKQGMNAMSLAHFLNACREIPELRAMAMQMMGCEHSINPDRERALAMLVNSYVRQP